MKRGILILLLLLIATSCFPRTTEKGSKLASINIVSREGISETFSNQERLKLHQNTDFLSNQPYQKVLRVYERDDQGDIYAYITSYHPNGQVRQYLELQNGRACGTYLEWHPNGQPKIEAQIINGEADLTMLAEKSWLFEGTCQAFDEQGNISAIIPYVRGQLQGLAFYYHPHGAVWKKVPFQNNQIDGCCEIFLDDGTLLQSLTYSNGIKDGPSTRYWRASLVAAEEMFSGGRIIQASYFGPTGKEISRIENGHGMRAQFAKDTLSELQEYRHGVLEGLVQVFVKNNRLHKTYHVKNGLKHGQEIEYYESAPDRDLRPKLLITWYEGKMQGVVRTWYDNGNLENQREMSNNVKNGLLTAWYRDGNLMMIEEYDQNKLSRGEYYKKGDKIPISTIAYGKGLGTFYDAEGHFLRKVIYANGVPAE